MISKSVQRSRSTESHLAEDLGCQAARLGLAVQASILQTGRGLLGKHAQNIDLPTAETLRTSSSKQVAHEFLLNMPIDITLNKERHGNNLANMQSLLDALHSCLSSIRHNGTKEVKQIVADYRAQFLGRLEA